ncbi:glucosyl-3-phosphoglycerate synthase [soil metagenome]
MRPDTVRSALPRAYHHRDCDIPALARAKGTRTVSVCLPARDEVATIGPIVATICTSLIERAGVVDEVVVIDDHSTDGTAEAAAAAGARVVEASTVLAAYGEGHGKGEALWKSVFVARGDVIVWCDADIREFDERFVVGLLGPLLTSDAALVKGFYDRPGGGVDGGGGRVTELVARPLLSLLFPHLAGIVQPLAGEYGAPREVLEQLPFVEGYGVDLALIIDVAERFGPGSLAQVDLGVRHHRNRPLDELGPQAMAVLQVALRRAGLDATDAAALLRPGREPVDVATAERPPLIDVPSYRLRSA